MPNMRVDAVLFDLDGTLVDESKSYREAIRHTAQRLLGEPVTTEEALAIKHHPGLNNDWDATWALLAQRRGGPPLPPTAEELQTPEYRSLMNIFQTFYLGSACWEHLSGETAPFAWDSPLISQETLLVSRETLEELRPFQLGIATSRPRAEALMALEQHALEPYFPKHSLVAREDAPREKPDPEPLLELARRLDCHHPVYVGDTVNDVLATEAVGMPFVAIGSLLQDWDLPYWLPDVNELPALLLKAPAGKGIVNG